jgi:hypothetical protein
MRRYSGLVVAYDDVFEASTNAEVDGATTTTTERTDDEDARVVASLGLALLDSLLDVLDEKVLVLIARHAGQRLVLAVLELPGPGQERESSTSETGVVAKRSNTQGQEECRFPCRNDRERCPSHPGSCSSVRIGRGCASGGSPPRGAP